MLSVESVRLIEASSGWRMHRIEMFELPDEGSVVVKGQRPARGPWRFRMLKALSRLTRNPLLLPVPSPGGKQAQQMEIDRLTQLRQAGIRVPEVLWTGEDYLVLRRIPGESLQHHFEQDSRQALKAFQSGLQGLLDVHSRQQYLSQGFARNILVSEGELWFIDFEDDPIQVMTLPDAQARDVLTYLLSAIWLSRAPRAEMMTAWTGWAHRCTPEVRSRVRAATTGLSWLRHLPRKRKPWGRDVVTVQALAEFLHHWNTSEPAL
jgi:tRNA A-37 threonylcarbamoyl transferase component Bud32